MGGVVNLNWKQLPEQAAGQRLERGRQGWRGWGWGWLESAGSQAAAIERGWRGEASRLEEKSKHLGWDWDGRQQLLNLNI